MPDTKTLSTSNNYFTADLYQVLFSESSSSNLIFSPFSVTAMLGMVGMGAKGLTRTEILNTLKLKDGDDENGKSFNCVLSGYQKASSPKRCTLLTASRIYTDKGYKLNPDFVTKLKKYFLAEIEQLDFSTREKRKKAVSTINNWVESRTKNKIKNLFNEGETSFRESPTSVQRIIGSLRLGFWKHQFNLAFTGKNQFHLSNSETIMVDMMKITVKFPHAVLPELDAEAIAMPYKGGRLSMVIILPNTVDGLGKLQGESFVSFLQGGTKSLKKSIDVNVCLPKFRIEASIGNLNVVLSALGIMEMFSVSDGDFGGIPEGATERPKLYVSNFIQKAFIEVNEEGAEAVAASGTGIGCYCCMGGPPVIPFHVTRPFYFQIVDHANGDLVLFSGHCSDPNSV